MEADVTEQGLMLSNNFYTNLFQKFRPPKNLLGPQTLPLLFPFLAFVKLYPINILWKVGHMMA